MAANDERERVVEAARKFFREVVLPIKCVGYPKCDGDLPGEPHIEECPLHRKNIPKSVETMADFALAHSAAERERADKWKANYESENADKKFWQSKGAELQREIEWWKTHAVVILDKEGEPRCQLKGDSLCPAIEANNRQLKTESAELQRRLDETEKMMQAWRDTDAQRAQEWIKGYEEERRIAHAAEAKAERYRMVLQTIADWPFNIQGDCVKDATDLAKQALSGEGVKHGG